LISLQYFVSEVALRINMKTLWCQ